MSSVLHLAQVNIARMNAPLDSAEMADFVARIAEINALADASPGFVWRLATDAGSSAYLRPYDDDRILFNMSVWRSVDDLRAYVYGGAHTEVMRRRHRWFGKLEAAYLALWWIPAGQVPQSTRRRRASRSSIARGRAPRPSPSDGCSHQPDGPAVPQRRARPGSVRSPSSRESAPVAQVTVGRCSYRVIQREFVTVSIVRSRRPSRSHEVHVRSPRLDNSYPVRIIGVSRTDDAQGSDIASGRARRVHVRFVRGVLRGLDGRTGVRLVAGRPRNAQRLRNATFTAHEASELRRLSEACGGWIVFRGDSEETWIPRAEWGRRFPLGNETRRDRATANKPLQQPNATRVRAKAGLCRDAAACARGSSRP